ALVRDEEQHGIGDLPARGLPSERNGRAGAGRPSGAGDAAERRVDQTGTDDVRADSAAGALERDVTHQSAERGFGGVVGYQLRARAQARDRGDEDDRGAVGEPRQPLAAAEHRTAQIDGEGLVPLRDLHGGEPAVADPDPDVQHHAVEAAETLDRLADHAGDVGLATDVGLDGEPAGALFANPTDGLLDAGPAHVADRDPSTLPA